MKMNEFKPFRGDAISKVTGEARYSGDIHMDGMLCAKAVRLPVPCAKIIRIDTDAAEKARGVYCVITRKDVLGPNQADRIGKHIFDQPILVGEGEYVRNMGDAVALVVADTDDHAARAMKLLLVEYEELPGIHTWQDAVAAGMEPACTNDICHGDIAEGFAQAAVIVEGSYFTPLVEHAYIEPEAGLAYVDEEGRLNIRVGTQAVRQQTSMVCEALGLPYDKVRIYTPYIGGGFGGKHSMSVHVFLGLCALLTKRPVRMVWTGDESVSFSCKKQCFDAKVKMGLDSEGHITALWADVNGPTSPYTGKSLGRLGNFMKYMLGAYRQPNVEIHGRMYNTTSMEIGAFRGVAGPDGNFIIEALINRAAAKVGISPLEIRRRNWFRNGDELAHQFDGCGARLFTEKFLMEETMDTALREAGELEQVPGKRCGRGFACGIPGYAAYHSDNQSNTKAGLTLNLDGTFTVRLSFPELGQGIIGMAESIMKQEFFVEPDEITVILSDSDKTPIGGELGFSLATVNAGAALVDACQKMKKELEDVVEQCMLRDPTEITFFPREKVFRDKHGSLVMEWADFKKHLYVGVANPTVEGIVDSRPEMRNLYGVTPVVCVADVAVDDETGEVEVLQLLQCEDTGKIIHYPSALGQMLGAGVMAMGTTLMEEFITKDGKALTPSLAEYLIPTAKDIPRRNRAVMIETNPASVGPYGAKGLGEHGMFSTNAAIANAIADAIGVYISTMPITAETVLRTLGKI